MRSFLLGLAVLICNSGNMSAQAVAQSTLNSSGARGLESNISLVLSGTTVEAALTEIGKQSGLRMVFGEQVYSSHKKVTLNLAGVSVRNAIAMVLRGTGLTYTISNTGQLLIASEDSQGSKAQGSIAGKIVDVKSGKGVSGATVSVGADTRGVLSSDDGSYKLSNVPAGTHIVTVRLVGYAKQTKSITVGEGASVVLDFKLEPAANVLDQVVVTGTVIATELKAVPSAITVITAKQLEDRGITHIDELFRGDVPGLYTIALGSNNPTDQVTMYSRGVSKLASDNVTPSAQTNAIKTYIDGVEMADPSYLSQIDPKSIERIEILTGPQASTIYGANAINGVMQVFTKRGRSGRPQITLGLSESVVQNNVNSALAPSHLFDLSASSTDGRVSYNVGSSWNYIGAWSPGKQTQRISTYGGERFQSNKFTIDLSARDVRTVNRLKGNTNDVEVYYAHTGLLSYNNTIQTGTGGLSPGRKSIIAGRTLGLGINYNPSTWWSHQLTLGSDLSGSEGRTTSATFVTNRSDTVSPGINISQGGQVRWSESYSSTLIVPVSSFARTTLTYGADHWRNPSWSLTDIPGFMSTSRSRNSKNSGAYAQGQLGVWDALFLTYGARVDWNPYVGGNAKVRPGRYGLSYSRDMGSMSMKLRGSYGKSIRPPASGETQGSPITDVPSIVFFGSGVYSTLPNSELGPEFQQGGEGGIELYFANRGSLVITRYNQTVDGLISFVSNVDSVRAINPGIDPTGLTICQSTVRLRSDGYCYQTESEYLNVGSVRNQGWESQASLTLGSLTTSGTYSWTKSRVIGITPRYKALLTGTPFARGGTFTYVPEHTFAVNFLWSSSSTTAALNVNGSGDTPLAIQFSDLTLLTANSRELRNQVTDAYRVSLPLPLVRIMPGYSMANFNASRRFTRKIDATLQINNLTNYFRNDYGYQYAVAGRLTLLGLKWRIQ